MVKYVSEELHQISFVIRSQMILAGKATRLRE